MDYTNQSAENKKELKESELTVTLFSQDDIVVTSGLACIAAGTKITMADGSFRNVEDVMEGDEVLAFDHEAGRFTGSEVIMAFKADDEGDAFTLYFSDGTELQIIDKHCFYEKESRRYVCFTMDNAHEYIGKHFYSAVKEDFIELIKVTMENKKSLCYTLYTKQSMNYIANGLLNLSDDVDYLLNLYEFDENLKADKEVLEKDIQKYGIFEYNSKCGISKEEYENWNSRYLNIAVGKGLITWNGIWKQRFEREDLGSGSSNSVSA